mmetsp:Transcript_15072/g.42823  ORF Transcript_15072/g.42823 Transcript_15072/m.42823 type:complete len:200 (-) Transcript_15072:1015-1614(-)
MWIASTSARACAASANSSVTTCCFGVARTTKDAGRSRARILASRWCAAAFDGSAASAAPTYAAKGWCDASDSRFGDLNRSICRDNLQRAVGSSSRDRSRNLRALRVRFPLWLWSWHTYSTPGTTTAVGTLVSFTSTSMLRGPALGDCRGDRNGDPTTPRSCSSSETGGLNSLQAARPPNCSGRKSGLTSSVSDWAAPAP